MRMVTPDKGWLDCSSMIIPRMVWRGNRFWAYIPAASNRKKALIINFFMITVLVFINLYYWFWSVLRTCGAREELLATIFSLRYFLAKGSLTDII